MRFCIELRRRVMADSSLSCITCARVCESRTAAQLEKRTRTKPLSLSLSLLVFFSVSLPSSLRRPVPLRNSRERSRIPRRLRSIPTSPSAANRELIASEGTDKGRVTFDAMAAAATKRPSLGSSSRATKPGYHCFLPSSPYRKSRGSSLIASV